MREAMKTMFNSVKNLALVIPVLVCFVGVFSAWADLVRTDQELKGTTMRIEQKLDDSVKTFDVRCGAMNEKIKDNQVHTNEILAANTKQLETSIRYLKEMHGLLKEGK